MDRVDGQDQGAQNVSADAAGLHFARSLRKPPEDVKSSAR